MILGAVTSVHQSISLLGTLVSLIGYAFYLFGGVALVFCALRYQQGDTQAMVKGLVGAAIMFTAPSMLGGIISLLG